MPDSEPINLCQALGQGLGAQIERAIDRGEANSLRLENKLEAVSLRTQEHITDIGLQVKGVAVELTAHRNEDNRRFSLVHKIILGSGTAGASAAIVMKFFS